MSADAVKEKIAGLITENHVMLFMKGSKQFPQCGFSATVVGILKELGVPFQTANVLTEAGLRDGVKQFSDWPTIPQLYVDGEFVGGCDIIREMHQTGELATLLKVVQKPVEPPTILLSEAAAKAFKAAEEPGEDKLRLEIGANFAVELFFAPKQANDVVVLSQGITILIDPASAKRANGVSIDYVEGPQGAGFKIENPNAPPSVKALAPRELATMLAGADPVLLIDVRTEGERATASIDGSVWLEENGEEKLGAVSKDAVVVFYCHHGVRSLAAADHFLKKGLRRVYNLSGGIDAWSREVDSSVPRY